VHTCVGRGCCIYSRIGGVLRLCMDYQSLGECGIFSLHVYVCVGCNERDCVPFFFKIGGGE
jgi:hypothetical protein